MNDKLYFEINANLAQKLKYSLLITSSIVLHLFGDSWNCKLSTFSLLCIAKWLNKFLSAHGTTKIGKMQQQDTSKHGCSAFRLNLIKIAVFREVEEEKALHLSGRDAKILIFVSKLRDRREGGWGALLDASFYFVFAMLFRVHVSNVLLHTTRQLRSIFLQKKCSQLT